MKLTVRHIADFLGIPLFLDKRPSKVVFDTRNLNGGELFFALKGEKVDGHSYLEEAKQKGAIAAVVSKEYSKVIEGLPLIPVQDPLKALGDLAREVVKNSKAQVIGITGSVGKTTTKEFLHSMLSNAFRVGKTPGNQNTKISFPTHLLNMEEVNDFLILEMGATHIGDIEYLTSITPVDYGILTHVSQSHLESFQTLEMIAMEKQKIFRGSKLKAALVNHQAQKWMQGAPIPIETYGVDISKADFTIKAENKGLVFYEKGMKSSVFHLPMIAPHHLENFVGAAAIARKIGMPMDEILKVARDLQPYLHRFQRIEKKGITFIDDAYNASVTSFRAAFETLQKMRGRRIAVIGEMRELGSYTREGHEIVAREALKSVDEVLCFGNECANIVDIFRSENRPAALFSSIDQLEMALKQILSSGDIVLVKGANSHQLWKVIERY
ncbi:MAG: UDP-N-acetylmuramoyl-tripeptide--D-alanyl-D-alanine ligase [Simkaniaceae bacterium]|nr:UDP-N-acetylmuramoyl-tripeptide--D-alanyl-D-alanine ligase [Simkaniaceae bacterium]